MSRRFVIAQGVRVQPSLYWSRVDKTKNCWMWTGALQKDGYGRFGVGDKIAHRISWEMHNGKIPSGLCVLHKCDVRRCVRPSHLFLGTRKDNSYDMKNKGRSARGEANWWSKLSDVKVLRIRRLRRDTNLTFKQISKLFGVTESCAIYAANGTTWAHVKEPE